MNCLSLPGVSWDRRLGAGTARRSMLDVESTPQPAARARQTCPSSLGTDSPFTNMLLMVIHGEEELSWKQSRAYSVPTSAIQGTQVLVKVIIVMSLKQVA